MNGEVIPAEFWMFVIGGLAILFGLILYHVAMLVKETTETVREVTGTVERANRIIDDAQDVVSSLRESADSLNQVVDEIRGALIQPVRSVGSVMNSISGFLEGLGVTKKKSSLEDLQSVGIDEDEWLPDDKDRVIL